MSDATYDIGVAFISDNGSSEHQYGLVCYNIDDRVDPDVGVSGTYTEVLKKGSSEPKEWTFIAKCFQNQIICGNGRRARLDRKFFFSGTRYVYIRVLNRGVPQ